MDKPLRPEVASKSTELMYFQASNAYSSSIAVGAILAALFWNEAPRLGILAWAVAYGIMIAIRHLLGVRFCAARRRGEDAQPWLYYFAAAVGICGVIWGVYGAFLAQYADTYKLAVVILALGAMMSGAVIAYSVSTPVFLAFSIPTMVPIGLWLAVSPVDGKRFLGMMVLVWVLFMVFAAQRFRRFALDSLGYQCNLEELAAQLKRLSSIDSLTNLANRRSFDEELDAAQAHAKLEAAPLALILCDIDFFKHYNDAYGQMQGDVCLRSIAAQLDKVTRRLGGWAARTGGAEFAVILRRANLESAARAAEDLRDAIEQLHLTHAKSPISGLLTASFGVCALIPSDARTDVDLLQRAEQALHEAKRAGRNRVCVHATGAPASVPSNIMAHGEGSLDLKSAHG